MRAFHRVLEGLRPAKTTLRRLKSLLIVALVALAIYMTGQLWFVNLSNRNFFLYLRDRITASAPDGYSDFVRPMRVIYGDGSGRFDISYSGLVDPHPRALMDTVLTGLFSSGTFIGVGETDFYRIFSRPVLIYEYAFSMPGSIFPLGFNQRTGAFLTGHGVDEFTSVAIWLPENADGLRVFFINDDRAWEFSVITAAAINFPTHGVPASSLHFVAAVLEGYDFLPPGLFIARHGGVGRLGYHPVAVINPYRTTFGGSLNHFRNNVTHFFANPATISARVASDGVWTVSSNHTTMRYYDTEVLEYLSFRPRRRSNVPSFMEDFSAALAFIGDDIHVVNEIFLAGFEERGTTNVFWFSYIVDNFPILLPEGWEVSSPEDILPYPIEVHVDRGQVIRYRRLAHHFELRDDPQLFTPDFDRFLAEQNEPVEQINRLSLGYLMCSNSDLLLGWLATFEDIDYEPDYEYIDAFLEDYD